MNSQVVGRLWTGDYQGRLHVGSAIYLFQEMVLSAEW